MLKSENTTETELKSVDDQLIESIELEISQLGLTLAAPPIQYF